MEDQSQQSESDEIIFRSKLGEKEFIFDPTFKEVIVSFKMFTGTDPEGIKKYEKEMEKAIEAEGKKDDNNQQSSVPLKVDGINGKWGFARVEPVTEKPLVLENSETFRYMTAMIDKSPCRCCNKPLGDNEPVRYFVPDRIIVKTNQKPEEFHGYAKDKFGLDFLYNPPLQTNTSVFEMSALESVTGKDLFATIDELNKNNKVEFAEPYEVVFDTSLYEPKDTHYTDRSQWGIRNASDGPSMKVYEAWNVDNNKQYQQGGITKQNAENWGNLGDPNPASTPNVIIAIIDSGVQIDHNDFFLSTDGDTDAFITGGNQNFSGSGGPTNVSDEDTNSHGTHLAGIAGARRYDSTVPNTQKKVVGVAPRCKILPLKVSINPAVINQFVSAIQYVIDRVASDKRYVICIGHKLSDDSQLRTKISEAISNNIVVVCAAGNDDASSPVYPAKFPNVIAAGASDSNDSKWADSNYGNTESGHPVIFAPGVNILSTIKQQAWGNNGGTSCSAAFLSGAAALILTRNKALTGQWLTPAGVRSRIINNYDLINGGAYRRHNLRKAFETTP